MTPSSASSSMPAVTTAFDRSDCEYRFPLTTSDYKVASAGETMIGSRTALFAVLIPLLLSPALAQQKERTPAAELGSKKPKYYFTVVEVNVGKNGDKDLAKVARELFEKELESRREFTSDAGGATEP